MPATVSLKAARARRFVLEPMEELLDDALTSEVDEEPLGFYPRRCRKRKRARGGKRARAKSEKRRRRSHRIPVIAASDTLTTATTATSVANKAESASPAAGSGARLAVVGTVA